MIKSDRIYRHALFTVAQECKRNQSVCGDLVAEERDVDAAVFAVFDGMGSGIKANIAAQMFSSRLMGLLRHEFTATQACSNLAATMHAARTQDALFSAFTLARMANDGTATVICYEMPAPLVIEAGSAEPARQRFFTSGSEVLAETQFRLQPGTAILILSDGVTQAGMGTAFINGWGIEGVRDFVNKKLSAGAFTDDLPRMIVDEARRIDGGLQHDDATAALLSCRHGTTLHVLTGPPRYPHDDAAVMRGFLDCDGIKVVCGSSTADILARNTGRKAHFNPGTNAFEPPEHYVEGVDLVTEGAVTLNQLYNIISEDSAELDSSSPVSKLLMFMRSVDRICFYIGGAKNPGHKGVIFRQLGLLPRAVIVPLIADKMRAAGKLVIIKTI